jgi:RNA polymerase sigma-70 factor (ECF subfamily)
VWARDLTETQDLVQETMVQAFKHIDRFEVRGEGALQAYLRQALLNRIRSEIRRVGRRPEVSELDSQTEDGTPSPLEQAIGGEAIGTKRRWPGCVRKSAKRSLAG